MQLRIPVLMFFGGCLLFAYAYYQRQKLWLAIEAATQAALHPDLIADDEKKERLAKTLHSIQRKNFLLLLMQLMSAGLIFGASYF